MLPGNSLSRALLAGGQQMTVHAGGNTQSDSNGSVRYYLILNGLDGGSAAAGFENAFEVTAAELGVAAGAGEPAFETLNLEVKAGSSLDELIGYSMSGRHFSSAQLVAVTGSGAAREIVADIKLQDAFVGGVGITEGNKTSLSLNYRAIEIGSDNGTAFETFGWNLITNSQMTNPIVAPVAGDENATGGFGNVTWSLIISGIDGGGIGGSFAVKGFDLSMETIQGGGSGQGRFSLGALNLGLELGSAADEIIYRLISGTTVSSAQLVGAAGGKTVYDYRLSHVKVTNADVHSDIPDTLSLHSVGLSLTTTNAAGVSETVSYNRNTTEIGSTPLAAAVATPEAWLNTGKTSWYLTVDGLDGGSRVSGHEGAFAITSFSYGGSTTSRFDPEDLTVQFEAGSNLDELLARLLAGTHIARGLRIVGDTTVGKQVVSEAYDLRLNTVMVGSVLQDSRGPDTVTFNYGALSLTTKNLEGVSETRSWNKQTTEIGTSPLTPAVAATNDAGLAPSRSTDYYMVIGGLDGGVGGRTHNLAFAIEGFTIDMTHVDGGGSGQGRVDYGALTVELGLGSSVAQLMGRLGNNTTFALQIVGDDPTRKSTPIIYDLRFDAATLQSLNAGNGEDVLVFNYGSHTVTTRNGDHVAETIGVNTATTEIINQPLGAAQGADLGALQQQSMKYYLVLDGMDGGVRAKGHNGAFAVNSFDFEMFREGGRAMSSLSLLLDLGSAEDELLRLAATGGRLMSAQIVGDTLGKHGKTAVYDLRLADLNVSGLTRNGSNRDELILTYSDASISTKNNKGDITTAAYDFGARTGSTTPLEAPTASSENWLGAGKTSYWLVLDSIHSGEGGKKHAGAFALDGFEFSVANLTTGGSGSGSGSGKAVFSLLEALLDSGAASDELMSLITEGTELASARIVGEAKVGKHVQTVYDLRLADLTVSELGLLDDDSIALSYGSFTLSTMNSRRAIETYGMDLGSGESLTTPLDLPTVGEL